MREATRDTVIDRIQMLLREAIEGPEASGSWFTDTSPDSGLLGSIRSLSAAQASEPLGGTTIAAHVHHVAFSLDVSEAWIRGEREEHDWASSWGVSTVNDEEWARLREDVRSRYERLQATIAEHAWDNDEAAAGAIAAIAHMACHLGAIRQKLAFSRT